MAHGSSRTVGHWIRTRALVISLVVGTLASCTGEGGPDERRYALPEALCGVDVDVHEYEALFPPGEEIVTDGEPIVEGGPLADCWIDVDGERAITVSAFPEEHDYLQMAKSGPVEIDMREGEKVAGEYEAYVWPHVAMATDDCTWRQERGFTLAFYAFFPDDDEESRQALAGVIQPYMRAIVESGPCTGGR